MSRIITFLGESCTERTTMAIAAAKWFAQQENSVLLVTHSLNPAAEILLGAPLNTYPQVIAHNLQVVQLQTVVLLERVWEEVRQLVTSYLPTSCSQEIYPGEVLILPGFDSILTGNALRQYYLSGEYDVIIYDGEGNLETIRMLGLWEALDWYSYRLQQFFAALDFRKIADSVGGPVASAFLTANFDKQKLQQGFAQVDDWIKQGVAVTSDAKRLTAYLVITDALEAIAKARWLWGSAQQVNLTVSGVLAYRCRDSDMHAELQQAFAPLVVNPLPSLADQNWQPLLQALPDFEANISVPQPLTVDLAQQQVIVFLPGFNKKQVKLTQYSSGIVIEAGDQRRIIVLPAQLIGQPIKAGKFEEPYLTISF